MALNLRICVSRAFHPKALSFSDMIHYSYFRVTKQRGQARLHKLSLKKYQALPELGAGVPGWHSRVGCLFLLDG